MTCHWVNNYFIYCFNDLSYLQLFLFYFTEEFYELIFQQFDRLVKSKFPNVTDMDKCYSALLNSADSTITMLKSRRVYDGTYYCW